MQLPTVLPTGLALQIATTLNAAEFSDNDPARLAGFGAWCAMPLREGDGDSSYLAHNLFLPNYFHSPGLATFLGVLGTRQSVWGAAHVGAFLNAISADQAPEE